ncbi:MAG: SDR family oxidoreductase [Propionibacteriaceae bacterium]|nr:SDR family oxidoreductase [Propionibacteriaceae bacterium]
MGNEATVLAGRVAVITGGSRGLGLEFARLLGRHGATVVLTARTGEVVERAAAELRDSGLRAHGLAADVGVLADVERVRDEALRHGVLDIWVNNAGAAGVYGPTVTTPVADFERVVRTNILGTFYGSRVALAVFLDQGHGDLVNLYGRGDNGPVPLQNAYASSKAWIRNFSRALQGEVKGTGVRVHGMNPGLVLTDMLGRVSTQPGFEEQIKALPIVAALWGQSPEIAARPLLDLVTSDRREFRDLRRRTMVTRGLAHLLQGRLRRARRMPMDVTVIRET